MKRVLIAAAAALILTSCGESVLPKDNWNKDARKALTGLIKEEGNKSRSYDEDVRPYAVFDFDNTTVVNDIELTSMTYVLENLRFAVQPENFYSVITDCVPDVDKPLEVTSDRQLTSKMFAEDISADYKYLYDNYISLYPDFDSDAAKTALKKIRRSKEFKDFRAKMWMYYDGVCDTFEYSTGCLWIQTIYDGMTYDQISSIIKEALTYYGKFKKIRSVTWESPDMGEAGKVSHAHVEGFAITKDMHDLYRALLDNGFDVYVCSASMEAIAEAAACEQKFGFGLDRDYVYGLRMKEDSTGVHHAVFDPEYHQTYQEGKTAAIKAYIASTHDGNGPALVAGDSNGDFSMLTSFSDLKVGLIIDCGNGGNLGKLLQYARISEKDGVDAAKTFAETAELTVSPDAQYVVQCRNYAKGKFIRKDASKPAANQK